ncbi:MAG: hypothetical protein AW08_03255 [Candidatus Accumulibacter adjunctus]|uniref:Uncharacterized protein n=1 Tax=Candidatus Accumulibacter adjunctus TaxID=1454001 RepID=A0A011MRW5_9PROT|nr:MAG: hypothetical protein AW08_03255 [Candidatus Accumulibacter adjunctus]
MTLLERIEDLKRRAQDQLGRQAGRDEAGKLQPLLKEANALSQGLGTEVTQMHLLRDQGLPLPDAPAGPNAGGALTTLDRLLKRFAEKRRAEGLTRGQDWTRFKESTQAARIQATTALDQAWRSFVTGAYSGDKPADLERSLAPTDVNKERLSRYRAAYEELIRLANRRPTGREDFDRVRELARQLKELHQGFDFGVPEGVKQFLQAIAKGGADLDLLTDEVRAWLQQQGSTGRYQIVAKRSAP